MLLPDKGHLQCFVHHMGERRTSPPIHRHTKDTKCALAQALRHDLWAPQDLFEESALLTGFVTLDNLPNVLESVPILQIKNRHPQPPLRNVKVK